VVYADDFTLRILGGKTMVVVVFIIILLALFVFILPYIIIAGMFAIPIYVIYYCIKQPRNRPPQPTKITDADRLWIRHARFALSAEEAELLF